MQNHYKGLLAVITIAALQACSTVPTENAQLAAAQAQLRLAQISSDVSALAPAELREAEMALDVAKAAWSKQGTLAEVDHLSYLASKKIDIAQTVTRQRVAEKAVTNAQGNRQDTLIVARTLEAEKAQDSAAVAQRNAQAAQAAAVLANQKTQMAEADTAAMKARLAEMDAKQTERGMVVTIGDLLFDNNSAVLQPGAGQSVQRLGAFLKAYPMRTALIEGYTDSVGSPQSNQSLSERRADAVKSALLATGVTSERLVVRGFGEGYPVGSNQTTDGRQGNRRVEVILSDDTGKVAPH